MRLECKAVTPDGDLIPIPCLRPEPVPRLYVAQHSDDGTFSRFVRHDVPKELRESLFALKPEEALHEHDRVKRLLAPYGACEELHYGMSYVCPNTFTPHDFPGVVRLTPDQRDLIREYDADIDPSRQSVLAVVMDGRIVATCQSARENEIAAEAWVRTLPEYRRRGLGKRVTAAWAAHAWMRGKVPFYSHRMDNVASQGVARSLGLMPFITDAAYA
jgi:hypothetical protein